MQSDAAGIDNMQAMASWYALQTVLSAQMQAAIPDLIFFSSTYVPLPLSTPFACEPIPACPLGTGSFLSLCAFGLRAIAWALSLFCQVFTIWLPPATAWGYTLVERGWRCIYQFLFSCKAFPRGSPDPTDLWLDLLDLLSCDVVATARVCQALHV
jgi:hypothetical protein